MTNEKESPVRELFDRTDRSYPNTGKNDRETTMNDTYDPMDFDGDTADAPQRLGDFLEAQTGGVDIVLLDNMVSRTQGNPDTTVLAEAVRRIGGRFLTEASGNVDLDTVGAIAETGVDFVSSGALTHSVSALDLSLKLRLA